MLIKAKLPEDSLDYIKQELSLGGVLSTKMGQTNLYLGIAYTYLPSKFSLPPRADYAESLEFLTGRKVSNEFDNLISDIMIAYLNNNPRKIVLFETIWEGLDPLTSKKPLQFFTINGRKYDYLKGNDNTETISAYLSDAKGYPTVISLANFGESELEIKDKSEFKEENVCELIQTIEGLIIGAFDGEGYLVWQKKSDI